MNYIAQLLCQNPYKQSKNILTLKIKFYVIKYIYMYFTILVNIIYKTRLF